MNHPYKRYESSPAWTVLWDAIGELVANQDLQETTRREYIVGFVLQRLSTSGMLGDQAGERTN